MTYSFPLATEQDYFEVDESYEEVRRMVMGENETWSRLEGKG